MIAVEEELIDRITATLHYLRTGLIPSPVSIPDGLPENEIHQLILYLNRFLVDFSRFSDAMEQLSQGELESKSSIGQMAVVETKDNLPLYANILLLIGSKQGDDEGFELYAKVIRTLDEDNKRCLNHFTSVSPETRVWLQGLESD